MAKYLQGFFKPFNPSKYKGDPTNIFFRSSWEALLMNHFDAHPDIIWWSSEEHIVRYRSPVDGKIHRYFPDFIINTKNKETIMIEVKPLAQTIEPKIRKTQTKKYINEVYTWGINSAKWSAAEEYCKSRGWKFQIMTEKDIYGGYNK